MRIALWLYCAWIGTAALADIARLDTRSLTVGLDRDDGRLIEFADSASGQNFAGATTSGLWSLELEGAPPIELSPTNARLCRIDTLRGADPGLRLAWSRFDHPAVPDLRVEVTIRLDRQQALSRWDLAVESQGQHAIERIRFPRIVNLPRLDRERLVMPFWGGLLARNPRQCLATDSARTVRREHDYPGHCSMQCLAFYSEDGPGLYLACDDTAGYRKLFSAFGAKRQNANPPTASALLGGGAIASQEETDLGLEIVHLPERHTANARRYVLPNSVRLGTFHGNWFDAAALYRTWAMKQPWTRSSRWHRGLVPPWIADTGLWVWNRGRSPDVLDPAIALQAESGLPIAVFWHWWHGCAYDTGFPEYLPPREGDASFMAALDRAHARNVRALVYMNQRLWGMTTASWTAENAAAFAVKGADGAIRPEVYNTFTRLPCATMCLATDFWRSKYSSLATEAFNRLGVDGIYMDQACSSLACYAPTHGHPLGGGTYWMNGFKTLAANIRQRCPDRGGVALAGEGCAENWLPYLDLMLALDVSRERYAAPDGWEPIPFFHAVYHGCGVFYGSYSSLTRPPYDDLWPAESAPKEPLALLDQRFSRQFFLEQARAFVWGQQPTLANFRPSQLDERPDEIAYAIRLARLRRLSLDYLQDGSMLPPPKVAVEREPTPMSRLSIYAGQGQAIKEFTQTVPLALASAWRAPNRRVALAVASIANRPVTAKITLDATRFGLRMPGRFHPIDGPRADPAFTFDGKSAMLTLDLAPLEAHLLEWQPGR